MCVPTSKGGISTQFVWVLGKIPASPLCFGSHTGPSEKRRRKKTNKTNVVCASMCVFCLSLLERKKAHIFLFRLSDAVICLATLPSNGQSVIRPSIQHTRWLMSGTLHTHTNNDGRQPAAAARLLHLLHPVKGILSLEADQISFHSILLF